MSTVTRFALSHLSLLYIDNVIYLVAQFAIRYNATHIKKA